MFTVPLLASAMPVPDPVPPVVIVTTGSLSAGGWVNCFWYAVAQALISGNSRVLPVSEMEAGVLAGAEGRAGPCMAAEVEVELDELPQAAARTVSGARTAAVRATHIRLFTGEYSFSY